MYNSAIPDALLNEFMKHQADLVHYLIVAGFVFVIGVIGIFLNRRNIILMFMCIELILLAVNINFIAFSAFLGDMAGQVFTIFILTIAAAEAAIGLAILVIYYRNCRSIDIESLSMMKG